MLARVRRFMAVLWYGRPCRICGDWPCQTVHFHATRDEQGRPLKLRPYPGPWSVDADPFDRDGFRKALEERNRKIAAWDAREAARLAGTADIK